MFISGIPPPLQFAFIQKYATFNRGIHYASKSQQEMRTESYRQVLQIQFMCLKGLVVVWINFDRKRNLKFQNNFMSANT